MNLARQPSLPPASQHGFSLIELMIAVVILAILASLAVPSMRNIIVQNRLASRTNELVGAIQFARTEAIKRNQRVSLCRAASATATACSTPGDWQHWIVLNSAGTLLQRGSLGATLTLSSTLENDTIIFLPSGLNDVAENKNTLTLCSTIGSGNIARRIEIGLAGRTSITRLAVCA